MNSYNLGFLVNGTPIPDPSAYVCNEQSLDTDATRDTNGLLHRSMVASKEKCELTWNLVDYATARTILSLVNGASFSFTFLSTRQGTVRTGTFYAGDRKMEAVWLPTNKTHYYKVSFNVIEY